MPELPPTVNDLVFVRHLARLQADDRVFRRTAAAGANRRIRRGVYAKSDHWRGLSELNRYRMRVLAVAGTRRSAFVISHLSAAALWGYPVIDSWPNSVDLLVEPTSGPRSKNGVIVHRSTWRDGDIVALDGLLVTSPARTLADLACCLPFEAAVAIIDHALNPHCAPAARAAKDEILACLDAEPSRRGQRRARSAIAFAAGASGSVGETRSRVAIYELGFPAPELQVRHPSANGSYFETDFEWRGYRQIGEFDGAGKYLKEEYLRGKSSGQAVYEEKLREDELRAQGNGVTRWGSEDLDDRALLRAKLLRAGLPILFRSHSRTRPRSDDE